MSMYASDGDGYSSSMYEPDRSIEPPNLNGQEHNGTGMRLAALIFARPKAARNQSRHSHWFNKTIHNHYGTDHHLSANVGPFSVGMFPRKRRRQ